MTETETRIAQGASYIEIEEIKNEKTYCLYPQVGDIIDCTNFIHAWVGGKPYYTQGNGWSQAWNVAGKKIKILEKIHGDARVFGSIKFEFVK